MIARTPAEADMLTKFGQLLLFGNLITQDQLDRALKYQKRRGGKLGEILHNLGYISTEDVTHTLGMKYGVPTVNLTQTHIDQEVLKLIPPEIAWVHRVIPIGYLGSTVACAMEDPTLIDVIELVEFRIDRRVQPILVTEAMMTAALKKYYSQVQATPSKARLPISHKNKWKAISEIIQRLQELSPDKIEQVQQHLDSITA